MARGQRRGPALRRSARPHAQSSRAGRRGGRARGDPHRGARRPAGGLRRRRRRAAGARRRPGRRLCGDAKRARRPEGIRRGPPDPHPGRWDRRANDSARSRGRPQAARRARARPRRPPLSDDEGAGRDRQSPSRRHADAIRFRPRRPAGTCLRRRREPLRRRRPLGTGRPVPGAAATESHRAPGVHEPGRAGGGRHDGSLGPSRRGSERGHALRGRRGRDGTLRSVRHAGARHREPPRSARDKPRRPRSHLGPGRSPAHARRRFALARLPGAGRGRLRPPGGPGRGPGERRAEPARRPQPRRRCPAARRRRDAAVAGAIRRRHGDLEHPGRRRRRADAAGCRHRPGR